MLRVFKVAAVAPRVRSGIVGDRCRCRASAVACAAGTREIDQRRLVDSRAGDHVLVLQLDSDDALLAGRRFPVSHLRTGRRQYGGRGARGGEDRHRFPDQFSALCAVGQIPEHGRRRGLHVHDRVQCDAGRAGGEPTKYHQGPRGQTRRSPRVSAIRRCRSRRD